MYAKAYEEEEEKIVQWQKNEKRVVLNAMMAKKGCRKKCTLRGK